MAACPSNPALPKSSQVVGLQEERKELGAQEEGGGAATLSGLHKPVAGGPKGGKMDVEGGKEGGAESYEFNNSRKEATPASSQGSASPGNKEEQGKQQGKRSKGEEGKQSKKRTEEGVGAGRRHGVLDASIEKKTVGDVGGAGGRGANTQADSKSPPAGGAGKQPDPAPSSGKGKQGKAETAPPIPAPQPPMQEETDGDGEKDGKETVSKVPLKVNLNNGTNGHVEDRKKNYIMNQGKGKKEDGEISKECLYPCLSRYRSSRDPRLGLRVLQPRDRGHGEEVLEERGEEGAEQEVVVAYCTLQTLHCKLYAARCTLQTAHCTLHTAHCTLHTAHCTLHTVHCTLYTVHCTIHYSVHCTLYTVNCSVHCTLYTVHCTLYTVHCTECTLHTAGLGQSDPWGNRKENERGEG